MNLSTWFNRTLERAQTFGWALLAAHCAGLILSLSLPTAVPLISTTKSYLFATQWQWIIAYFGFIPFLLISEKLTRWKSFFVALMFSTSYFCYGIYWINIALVDYGNVPLFLSLPVYLLLVLYASIHWAVALHLAQVLTRRLKIRLSVSLPVVFTAFELSRNYLFTGFSWHSIAYSQNNSGLIEQSAALWGVYGLTFFILLINSVIYELWRNREASDQWPKAVPHRLAMALMLSLIVYGVWRIHANDRLAEEAPELDVAIVQGNIEQGIKNLSMQHADAIRKVYVELSDQIPDDVDLVVWPEAAYPWSIPRATKNFQGFFDWESRDELPWNMLIGVPVYRRLHDPAEREDWGSDTKYYNSAMLIEKDFDVADVFDKSHLVPFSEYMPKFVKNTLGIKKLVPNTGSFEQGEQGSTLDWETYKAGVLICFEGVFPEVSRRYGGDKSDFLVNLTNDAWFGVSSMLWQHLSMYSFRASENRKYLVRAANTGISAIISPSGQIIAQTDPYKRTVLRGKIKLLNDWTLYSVIGDTPAWGCMAVTFFWLFRLFRKKKKKK